MDIQEIIQKMNTLEFHQKLLLEVINNHDMDFYKLVVENSIDEKDMNRVLTFCETLSKELEEQKAEGFVYFHPLYHRFLHCLPPQLEPRKVIRAFIKQKLFVSLMNEFLKYC